MMNIRRSISILVAAAFLVFPVCRISATIVSGTVTGGKGLPPDSRFIKLTVPFRESKPENTVGRNNFQSPHLYGFDEGQNIDIPEDLKVDILSDGRGGEQGRGVIPAGVTVASHYIFFDPRRGARLQGSIHFDSYIIGIITSTNKLKQSDFLVNTSVNYQNPGNRGLEQRDSVRITGLYNISIDWQASSPGDYIRVLTLFSPGAVTAPTPGTRPSTERRHPPHRMGL
ncbi:MAG TPA: hypothetical protein ENJ80_10740 [Gammaproteobacteria bacterium]|nr:hypothetical protein [Gammaproteobacteria bacterium]